MREVQIRSKTLAKAGEKGTHMLVVSLGITGLLAFLASILPTLSIKLG